MLYRSQLAEVFYGTSNRRDQRIARSQATYITAHKNTSAIFFRRSVIRALSF